MQGMRAFGLIVLLAVLAPAGAAVVSSGSGGFVVRHEVRYPGAPAAAWARLVRVQDWWGAEHTYSGDAARLSLAAEPGGCWCERLANGGFVRHLDVVLVMPRRVLRLSGGLGPLQGMGVSGALTFTLKADGAATVVVAEYAVSGYSAEGLAAIAPAVDGVLGAQLARYATP